MTTCPHCGEVNHGRAPDCARCRQPLAARPQAIPVRAVAVPVHPVHPVHPVPPTRLGPSIQAGGAAQGPPPATPPRAPDTVFTPQAHRHLAGWLVVLRSGFLKLYQEIPLYEGQTPLGRARLLDERVSEHHALVAVIDGVVTLADLGSANGTTVNRQRVVAPVVLTAGAEVRLGGTTLVFVAFTP